MSILNGSKEGIGEIALTFDDGPSAKTTPKLLDVLAKYEIKAMFFLVGERIASTECRHVMMRAHQEGHIIANHTFSHKSLPTLSDDEIREDANKTQVLLGECSHELKFLRQPYGDTNSRVDRILREEGYTTVLWNVDALDWHKDYKENGAWVDHAMIKISAQKNSIVLMHDVHQTTVDYVEKLIGRIKQSSNVEFVPYTLRLF
jgi:peptidoglycan/xylan/chitin deacetylase (PgdA/CDA1 family)